MRPAGCPAPDACHAAGALLIKEAGGRVGDFAGGVDFLRAREVIAAAPGVFTALREAIAKARRP